MAVMIELVARRAYLVETDQPLTAADFPEVPAYDRLFLDGKEVDIKSLRLTLMQFQQRPAGKLRLLVINRADRLKELLQNTLLKVLEEPPSLGSIVLQAESLDSLLPTLRSRLAKVRPKAARPPALPIELDFNRLYRLNRDEVVGELEAQLRAVDLSRPEGVNRHQLLSRAVKRLGQNVNVKLTLDWLDLNWGH